MRDIIDKFPEFDSIAKKYGISGFVKLNKENDVKDALTKNLHGLLAISHDYFGESHCVELTGWNDKTDSYKFKNSWGTDYRDNGYGEIPKKEINQIYLPILNDIKLPFEDVSEEDWFFKYIKHVYFNGYMKGTSDTKFEPDKPLTRAEFATVLYRILKDIDSRNDIINREMNRLFETLNRKR